MNLLEEFKKKKRLVEDVKDWFAKYGTRYEGGGGGYGKIFNLTISACQIYFQAYDGDKNYHEAETEFNEALAFVVKNNFDDLARQAIQILECEKQGAAEDAAKECRELLKETEIPIPIDKKV